MKVGARKGAQHSGTVRGFGAANGRVDRGRRRYPAERSNDAVVKVIAKVITVLTLIVAIVHAPAVRDAVAAIMTRHVQML